MNCWLAARHRAVRLCGAVAKYQTRFAHIREVPPPCMLAHSYKGDVDVAGWYYSEKLDGIRAVWAEGKLRTRNGVRIETPAGFRDDMINYFKGEKVDGELFVKVDYFQETMGAVMKHVDQNKHTRWKLKKGKKVVFVAFDLIPAMTSRKTRCEPFSSRMLRLQKYGEAIDVARSRSTEERPRVQHISVIKYKPLSKKTERAKEQVEQKLKAVLAKGGEGLMLRKPDGVYVNGRSPTLLKVKAVEETEALVTDWAEGLGRHEGFIGALRCRLHNGNTFEVGSGLSDTYRYGANYLIGKVITVRHQGFTKLGVPRFPTFIGVRLDRSVSEFEMLSACIEKMDTQEQKKRAK